MRYRRKVRQDVEAELAAHFEDELKDHATDEEKEQKAQRLIAEFGDVKLLAVLVRRAKKRCRPLWQTIVARTFQAVGVLILCFIVYVVWFLTGKPIITTDYVAELNRIVRPTADESLNAAPLYLKAVDLYNELSDDFLLFFAKNCLAIVDDEDLYIDSPPYFVKEPSELPSRIDRVVSNKKLWHYEEKRRDVLGEVYGIFYKFLEKNINELTVEQRNIAQRWLQEHNDDLELIIEGSQRPYYWRTYGGRGDKTEMMGILLPNVSAFRDLARSLRWRAWLSAGQGRFEDALDHMKCLYRLGQHLRGDKFFIEQLVGITIEELAVHTIRDIVGEYEIDSMILAELQVGFEQIVADENFTISFKAERLMMYDEIQRCFTSDRIGKGHLYLPRLRKISDLSRRNRQETHAAIILYLFSSPLFFFGHPSKQETLRMANEFYDYCEQLSLKTAAQIHVDSDTIDHKLNEFSSDNILIRILTRFVKRIIERGNQLPTDVRATLTIIATLRYKKDTGRFPQNLNQLVSAGYLKQLPMDSYSDKPLVYRRTDDNFILYSIGPNFTDNGAEPGKDKSGRIKNWMDNGDTIFWPVPKVE